MLRNTIIAAAVAATTLLGPTQSDPTPAASIETAQCVHFPTGYNPNTTPMVLVDGCYIPDESPDGGYPTGTYEDNSPVYTDGWMLLVNDQTHEILWTEGGFGAGAGAKCGTDAQCADYSRSIGEAPSGYAAGH